MNDLYIMPSNFVSSAVIVSDGEPVAVIVNDASEINARDSASYVGIPVE